MRVLLVAGDPPARQRMAAWLESHGETVTACADRERALHHLETDPDLSACICDLPEGRCVHLIRFLRDREFDIPVIAVLDPEDAPSIVRAFRAGAEDVVLRKNGDLHFGEALETLHEISEQSANRRGRASSAEYSEVLMDMMRDLNAVIRRQLQVVTISREVTKTISRSRRIEEVIRTVREGIREILGIEDVLWYRYIPEDEEFALVDHRGREFEEGRVRLPNPLHPIIWETVNAHNPRKVAVTELAAESPGVPEGAISGNVFIAPLLSLTGSGEPEEGIRMAVHSGRFNLHGALLVLDESESDFTDTETMEVLASFATQAAIAIQNCHFYEMKERENQRLRELDELKSRFLSSVSHELRTPLTSIREFTSILLDHLAGELTEEQREIVQIVSTNGEHLYWLIENLLDVSRIEAGRFHLDLEEGSIGTLAASVVKTVAPQAAKRGLSLDLHADPLLAPATFDRHRMREVLINLVHNAIKFTPEGGRITIEAANHPDGDDLVLKVSDTGIGIPEPEIGKVFGRFYRLENDADSCTAGVGLGLSIVKEIVQAHGGEISVQSRINAGTTFIVRLPRVPPQPNPHREAGATQCIGA